MGIKQYFSVLCITATLHMAISMKLSDTQRMCGVGGRLYGDGAKFDHYFDGSPCKFQCTCLVRKVKGVWMPAGSCVHRCPAVEIPPYGCEPITDGCCTTSYVCPQGEKCRDEETGLQYVIGTSWERQGVKTTCKCTCYGGGVGRYQCECGAGIGARQQLRDQPREVVDVPEETVEGKVVDPLREVVDVPEEAMEEKAVEKVSICVMDDSEHCAACPIGMTSCPIRAKCERWPYLYMGINMECMCGGRKGTRCVSIGKSVGSSKENSGSGNNSQRTKRSTTDNEVVEIFFSEYVPQRIEPSEMVIVKDAKYSLDPW